MSGKVPVLNVHNICLRTMAQSPQSDVIPNGPAGEEDLFERDLKEMLKDGPNLNDLSSTVQGGGVSVGGGGGGTHSSTAAHSIPRSMPAKPPTTLEHIPRSQSVPPGKC